MTHLQKPLTTHAAAAKAIRAELKQAFPSIQFSVKSESFSGGNAVRISYRNGVSSTEVEKITKKYQYGSFDAMTDMYNNTNERKDIPQVKWVQVQREVTKEVREAIKAKIAQKFGINNPSDEQEWRKIFSMWSDQVIWRETQSLTF